MRLFSLRTIMFVNADIVVFHFWHCYAVVMVVLRVTGSKMRRPVPPLGRVRT